MYKNVRVGPQFVLYAEDVYEVMMAAVLLYIMLFFYVRIVVHFHGRFI